MQPASARQDSPASALSPFWRDRPVFVTGATGLVGGWLVRRLVEQGAQVTALVRDHVPMSALFSAPQNLVDQIRVVHGDVTDQALLERAIGEYECEVVFHLAAQTIVGIAKSNPMSTWSSNVMGTAALLEACRRSPRVKSIVAASSDKAYGRAAELPYNEDTPLRGLYPYDASKSCSDLIAQSYAATWKTPVCITRCGNFFGGGDLNWNRIVPGTIRSIFRKSPILVRSSGTLVRDYFYVEDGAEAYMHVAKELFERPGLAGHAFNLSNERPLTVLAMIDQIRTVMGARDAFYEPQILNEATHEIGDQHLDASKARLMLDYSPRYDLPSALARTVSWYRDFFSASSLPSHD